MNKGSFTHYVYKTRWIGGPKMSILFNVHTIENVNAGGEVVKKKSQNLVNVVCELPLLVKLFWAIGATENPRNLMISSKA